MKIIHWDGDGIYDQIDSETDIYFKQGWASLMAEETVKSGKYKVEKWRADPLVKNIRQNEVKIFGQKGTATLDLLNMVS